MGCGVYTHMHRLPVYCVVLYLGGPCASDSGFNFIQASELSLTLSCHCLRVYASGVGRLLAPPLPLWGRDLPLVGWLAVGWLDLVGWVGSGRVGLGWGTHLCYPAGANAGSVQEET